MENGLSQDEWRILEVYEDARSLALASTLVKP